MSAPRILELRFGFDGLPSDFEQAVGPLVGEFAVVSGLIWEIWLMDEDRREAGGICLFRDRGSAEAFQSSRLLAEIRDHPAVSRLRLREYEVIRDLTRFTRGPVQDPAASAAGGRFEPRFGDRRDGIDRRSCYDRRSGEDRRSGDERRQDPTIAYPDRRSGAARRSGKDRRSGRERRALAR